MPKQLTDYLLQLIGSLTPAEKRHFRLMVNRQSNADGKLFMQLFDFMDKNAVYEDEKVLVKLPNIKPSQLSNVKANLYRQLLTSLRQIERNNHEEIGLRENLDYAYVLYGKGLYKASLDILDKAKKTAINSYSHVNALAILEFEKHIESQHITGSMYPKAEQITEEIKVVLKNIEITHKLSNLSLSLYGLYLQYGYVKNKRDYHFITDYFKSHLPEVDQKSLGFFGKLYLYQCYVWYYFMTQDFSNNFKYAQKWVDIFHKSPEFINKETPLYLKGLHNVLNSLFMLQRYDKFLPVFEELKSFNEDNKISLNKNEASLLHLFKAIHTINYFYLTGDHKEGVKQIGPIEQLLEENKYNWDLHRMVVLNYKIACVYFGSGDLENTIQYLNKITMQYYPSFREDIQAYARILNLIAHFDLGNDDLVAYQIKSVYRFLLNIEQMQSVLQEIFKFLRKTPRMLQSELKKEFVQLRQRLEELEKSEYERRPFLYLDILSWLDSKIEHRPISEVIKDKRKKIIEK